MKLSQAVKPITYLKTHASQLVRDMSENRGTYFITHNGEAKAVLQDIESYEETQETLALLKMLALSARNREEGRHRRADKAFAAVRSRIARGE